MVLKYIRCMKIYFKLWYQVNIKRVDICDFFWIWIVCSLKYFIVKKIYKFIEMIQRVRIYFKELFCYRENWFLSNYFIQRRYFQIGKIEVMWRFGLDFVYSKYEDYIIQILFIESMKVVLDQIYSMVSMV